MLEPERHDFEMELAICLEKGQKVKLFRLQGSSSNAHHEHADIDGNFGCPWLGVARVRIIKI
jgi:hypothetical protein